MPQLTVRGIDVETMRRVSTALVQELAEVCGCGTDNFTLDCMSTSSVFDGAAAATYPFIEAAWFDRGREVRDRFAEAVTRHLREAGVAELEVAFKVYREDSYYVNGKAFASTDT
ncbi:DUF1904 family protein [Paenibacillus chartarius]|uniref:DUF1904 family protein n=1 Tax=Paenibacillus chartarius TaxID=747481 RepID=A0ABV6DHR5_9BACL